MITKFLYKPLGRAWAIGSGIMMLAIGVFILVGVIRGMISGKIWWFIRHDTVIIARADRPGIFWFAVASYSVLISFFIFISIYILRGREART